MESFEVLSIRDHQSAITSGKGEQYPVGVKFYKTPSDKLERFVLGEQQEFLIDTRLPAHIYNQSELCVPVQPFFGIALTNWSEVLAAASLLSRQELGQTVVMLRKFCSDAMIKRLFNIAFIAKLGNKIGKNCNIHPTAHVEGSVIGDNVEIGPYCYVRSSYIEDNVTIREHSSIKVSYLSAGAFTMPCDMFNAFVGRGSVIFTSILHNSYFGHDSFIGGASGFSDFDFYNKNVPLSGLNQDSNHRFLGSAVGDNCRIGAGIVFKSGLMIPSGTTILNHEMIKEVPVEEEQFYIKNKDKLLRVPEQFITGKKS
jgi:carbonic anhydrase/acetyltransferase-like protein (isoleucine patch superfamily)